MALFVHLPVPLPRCNEPGGNQTFFKFSFVFALEPWVTFFKFCWLNSRLVKFLSTDQVNIFLVQRMAWVGAWVQSDQGGEEAEAQNTGKQVMRWTQKTVNCVIFQGGCGAELATLQKQKGNFHLDPCTLFCCPRVHTCADTMSIIQGDLSPWKPHLGRV